ncbi:MAG: undecaprenyl-diphosphate phosphatase [Planctomycetota bacterium]
MEPHLWQAIALGVLQGASELFPVSSLGHLIVVKALTHWQLSQNGQYFLSFAVALHVATALALMIYFWKEWKLVLLAFWGSLKRRQFVYDDASKFAWLLVAGTLVVGAVGLVFEKKFKLFFEDPHYYWLVAVFLILNGALMLFGDYMKSLALRRAADKQLQRTEDLSFPVAFAVGAAQTLALFPGISRSGVAIVGGILAKLSYEESCRFAFMLATPVIGAAGLLKLPGLFKAQARPELELAIPAALAAGITAYLSTTFLMKYFEKRKLWPFAIYCVVLGAVTLAVLLT